MRTAPSNAGLRGWHAANCWFWCILAFPLQAADLSRSIEELQLPALRVNGRPARAHTQGLEIEKGYFYVTARLDAPKPRRPLLLRTTATADHWDMWDNCLFTLL